MTEKRIYKKHKVTNVWLRRYKSGLATWFISYYHQGRQIKERVGPDGPVTERMAREALKARLGEIAQGKFNIAQTRTYPAFDKALDAYIEGRGGDLRPEAHRRDVTAGRHLKRLLGSKTIDQIDNLCVERYRRQRREELITKAKQKNPTIDERDVSLRSYNIEHTLLCKFYNALIRQGRIDSNPTRGTKKFRERSIERYLSEQELQALLQACDESKNTALKTIIITAINTGLRYSELMSLRVQDLDFRAGVIYVNHTKNGERGRIPMNDHLRLSLQAHLKGHTTEYLWCDKSGEPLRYVKRAWGTVLKKAGIKDFRFHDLRHTFASYLAMGGVDLYSVQGLMRHKSFAMTQRYAHLSPHHQRQAVNTLNSLFNNPLTIPQKEEAEDKALLVV